MTTKAYHQKKHRAAAMRRFSKIRAAWTHNRKQHAYTCRSCSTVLVSLKHVWAHRCPPGTVKAPPPTKAEEA
jgi:hypothetical protein